ncbi:DNA-binding transcriptional activator of the SARP family [Micromonospora marina]|uniref:DNA-binding transcriptional activator of the SARP family n=2 Tax=Micromonospora marina TaxID=307120 RepID=A0A1C5AFR3_9ACTN|nr:DNA-binding transcriptional activator of the SARP family [Micromonospora marina]
MSDEYGVSAEPGRLDLRLLGPVQIRRDGMERPLGSGRRIAVLCVLALHAGRAVSRDRLVAAVWGDDPPASATGNVYTYISTLRHLLEPGRDRWTGGRLLTSGGGTYQLHVAADSVDVVRFEALRESARAHRAAGDPVAELAAVESALRLWRGVALAGVPGPFVEAQRRRLAELRLATRQRYADLLTVAGRHDEALRVLRELAATHPARESVRATLAVPLQVAAPGVEATRTHAAAATARPGPGPARTGSSERPVLVGRRDEVRRLRRAAAGAAAGHGASIRVEGAAGIGKSALLAAALRGAARTGWAVGDEVAQRRPLGVLLECLGSALAGEPTGVALVAQLAGLDATGSDAEVADRAVEVIRRAVTAAPLVLVVDDLPWADPLTLRVWAMLGAQARRLPLLLVAAARTGATGTESVPAHERIELAPLGSDAAAALVRAAAGEPPDPQRLARILHDAAGSPYYLRHLAAAVPGDVDLAAAVDPHLAPLPEQVRHRLRTVALLAGYGLTAAGTEPAGCTLAELSAVTDRSRGDLLRTLGPALAAGVLAHGGDRLEFRHPIVARALYECTPAALRGTLHRSFAERLAACGAPPERVAAQLLAGEVPLDRATGEWLAGHIELLAERAPRIAIAALDRARTQADLEPARRLSLTAWLARLLLEQERNAVAAASWVAARTTDLDLEGEMRWVAARSYEQRGEFEAAADIAWSALREHRLPPHWTGRLKDLLTRIRPHLPGDPTAPRMSRSALVGGQIPVLR